MATERIEIPATPTLGFANKAVTRKQEKEQSDGGVFLLVVVLCLVVLWPLVTWAGAQLLIVKSDLAAADAIVVMSGSATYLERADLGSEALSRRTRTNNHPDQRQPDQRMGSEGRAQPVLL